MAGNLLNTYGAKNLVIVSDYTLAFSTVEVGEPELQIVIPQSGNPTVTPVVWHRALCEESMVFRYVGMDYDTAQTCADAMRTLFTFYKSEWRYGLHLNTATGNWEVGWYSYSTNPTLESEIDVVKEGNGCMYDVEVNARSEQTEYGYNWVSAATSRPMADILKYIPGYSTANTLSGQHFTAAGADNIVLVKAPTRTMYWELVGEDIYTTKSPSSTITGWDFQVSNWWRLTVDSYADVKYVGMTQTACRNLQSSLNTDQNGWFHSEHPWELNAWFSTSSDPHVPNLNIGWQRNNSSNVWSCLNQFSATKEESGLWTAELSLHSRDTYMLNNTTVPQLSYPAEWQNIPGFSRFL